MTGDREAKRPRSRRKTTRSPASRRPSKGATSGPPTPERPLPRFHFVGGKGGVGKTTCSAAFGLLAARSGARVLVASADPAPSLGDAFRVELSAAPRPIPAPRLHLFGAEIDASRALRRWIDERRPALASIAVDGTWLDREDVEQLLRLSLPGIDELAALFEIARLADADRFDHIVIDTAPTGHTLRMLDMPRTLFAVASVFDHMREKRRVVEEALRGSWREGPEDALIAELADVARRLSDLLRDPERTSISWVTLPEPMAVVETSDALRTLRAAGMPVTRLVANQLTPSPPSRCGYCDARMQFERRSIRGLPETRQISYVHASVREPRGLRALSAIVQDLESGRPPVLKRTRPSFVHEGSRTPRRAVRTRSEARVILFGGKGGVGKTTCATAEALEAAARKPARRVLLISVDPAHSLSDVLGEIGSGAAGVAPASNLTVRELDAVAVLDTLKRSYADAIDRLFDDLAGGGSLDAAYDRAVMRSLLDLAPPGLDELAAILEITEGIARDAPDFDLVVIDTAPSGHAIRLLEMPALVQEWTRALMKILLKYQGVVRLEALGGMLLRLSQGLGRLRALLTDPRQTEFVIVTRPAALPRLETGRLARRLGALRIHVPAVIVNAVGRGECANCQVAEQDQQRELRQLHRELAGTRPPEVLVAPAWIPPPHGTRQLRRFRDEWRKAGRPKT